MIFPALLVYCFALRYLEYSFAAWHFWPYLNQILLQFPGLKFQCHLVFLCLQKHLLQGLIAMIEWNGLRDHLLVCKLCHNFFVVL